MAQIHFLVDNLYPLCSSWRCLSETFVTFPVTDVNYLLEVLTLKKQMLEAVSVKWSKFSDYSSGQEMYLRSRKWQEGVGGEFFFWGMIIFCVKKTTTL